MDSEALSDVWLPSRAQAAAGPSHLLALSSSEKPLLGLQLLIDVTGTLSVQALQSPGAQGWAVLASRVAQACSLQLDAAAQMTAGPALPGAE